jgi:hypothetical protein
LKTLVLISGPGILAMARAGAQSNQDARQMDADVWFSLLPRPSSEGPAGVKRREIPLAGQGLQ